MCRNVYYKRIKSEAKAKTLANEVVDLVMNIRLKMPRIGTRKLYYLLYPSLQRLGVGRDKLFEILKANRLLIKKLKNYTTTTDSFHHFHKHKNLIEDLVVTRPEQVFVSDITYLGTRDYPMYLALVTDAYSKKIMGYDLSSTLAASGAVAALKMALKNRIYCAELIHHSDRGLQYCCNEYQEVLSDKNILCSMTEKYDPYQNAIAERVNGILKQEFVPQFAIVNDLHFMKKYLKQAIGIYNEIRPHLSCSFLTPQQMHLQDSLPVISYKKIRQPSA